MVNEKTQAVYIHHIVYINFPGWNAAKLYFVIFLSKFLYYKPDEKIGNKGQRQGGINQDSFNDLSDSFLCVWILRNITVFFSFWYYCVFLIKIRKWFQEKFKKIEILYPLQHGLKCNLWKYFVLYKIGGFCTQNNVIYSIIFNNKNFLKVENFEEQMRMGWWSMLLWRTNYNYFCNKMYSS